MKRRNIVVFSFEELEKLMGLDDEHHVRGAYIDFRAERIEVMIEGPKCNLVNEGEEVSWIDLGLILKS